MMAERIIWSGLWMMLGIVTLWILAPEGNLWITASFAVYFFGQASRSIFQAIGVLKGETRASSTIRGLRVMAACYVLAGSIGVLVHSCSGAGGVRSLRTWHFHSHGCGPGCIASFSELAN